MSKQEVRSLMSADYRKYVADMIAAYPIQARNRAHYESFEASALLGSVVRKVCLKGNSIDKGRVVLYAPDSDASARMGEDMVTVWWQGCICPAVVKKSKIKAL